jgi:hypothetical protein
MRDLQTADRQKHISYLTVRVILINKGCNLERKSHAGGIILELVDYTEEKRNCSAGADDAVTNVVNYGNKYKNKRQSLSAMSVYLAGVFRGAFGAVCCCARCGWDFAGNCWDCCAGWVPL